VKFLILDEGDELLTPNFKVHWSESLSLCVCACVCIKLVGTNYSYIIQPLCCCQGLIWSGWRTMSVLLAGVTGGHLLLNLILSTPGHQIQDRATLSFCCSQGDSHATPPSLAATLV